VVSLPQLGCAVASTAGAGVGQLGHGAYGAAGRAFCPDRAPQGVAAQHDAQLRQVVLQAKSDRICVAF